MIANKQTIQEGQEDKKIYEFFKESEAETTTGEIVTIKVRENIMSQNELEVRKANLEAELASVNEKLDFIIGNEATITQQIEP
jgi:hypothetical protein